MFVFEMTFTFLKDDWRRVNVTAPFEWQLFKIPNLSMEMKFGFGEISKPPSSSSTPQNQRWSFILGNVSTPPSSSTPQSPTPSPLSNSIPTPIPSSEKRRGRIQTFEEKQTIKMRSLRSENAAFLYEQQRIGKVRPDLKEKIVWRNQLKENAFPYDIESFYLINGEWKECLVEVKCSVNSDIKFHMSSSEHRKFHERFPYVIYLYAPFVDEVPVKMQEPTHIWKNWEHCDVFEWKPAKFIVELKVKSPQNYGETNDGETNDGGTNDGKNKFSNT